MNLNQLEAYCLVVKTGSITKAAKKLHISQPALSLQIQDLENSFQVQLLDRSNKGVRPTKMGQIVFDYSSKILSQTANMRKEIESHRKIVTEELYIGASCTLGNYALPCSIYIFKEKFPQHNINLDITNTKNVVDKLLEGSINIGVIEGPLVNSLKETIKSERLKIRKIGQDELVITAPYNDEWQNRNYITEEELSELKLILMEKGSGIRETIEEAISGVNIPWENLNVVLELNSINAVISAVIAKKNISILPKMALRKEFRHRTLKALNMDGLKLAHNIYLIYPDNLKPGLASTFVDFLCSKEKGFC